MLKAIIIILKNTGIIKQNKPFQMFSSKIKILIIISASCLFFTTCKKYPKNYLWFKAPAVVIGKNGNPWRLVYYSVNDVDSTNADFLKVWREQGFFTPALSKDYNKTVQKFECFDVFKGFWSLNKKKKEIRFGGAYPSGNLNSGTSGLNVNYTNQRYIFLKFGTIEEVVIWKIDKLTPNDLRVIAEFNNIKYEMHFK